MTNLNLIYLNLVLLVQIQNKIKTVADNPVSWNTPETETCPKQVLVSVVDYTKMAKVNLTTLSTIQI